jgi:hypothetical protein
VFCWYLIELYVYEEPMPTIYVKADQTIHDLANEVIKQWYQDLHKVKLQLGILFAISGRESQPAVTENGYQVDGITKIVPLRDRITKGFDVELIIDFDFWKNGKREHHVALLDDLLVRLEVKRPKPKKKKKVRGSAAAVHGTDEERDEHTEAEFITDDIGRPVLKKRKGDYSAGIGYQSVIERHGGYAPEHGNLERAMAVRDAAMRVNAMLIAETPEPLTEVAPTIHVDDNSQIKKETEDTTAIAALEVLLSDDTQATT